MEAFSKSNRIIIDGEVIEIKHRNIGIALSGGGIRAMLFHLGLFKWLAENKLLEHVKRVSTVSGASFCVGMIYAHNGLEWPTSDEFLCLVLPKIKKALQIDLQQSAMRKWLISPNYWNKKNNIFARVLESKWGVHGKLCELEGDPVWYINCTTYETGKRFRFCRENMGDYTLGYVEKPRITLSEVMAASAGFPGLIGPYKLKISDFNWTPHPKYSGDDWQYPHNRTLHLWDGGVYDNLGLESIFKPDNGGTLSEDVEFLIVSNASIQFTSQVRGKGISIKALKRILDISMNQVASLRSREVMDFIKRTGQGIYLNIGNSAEKITSASKCSDELKALLIESCLSAEQADKAMNYPTILSKPNDVDFQMLLRHGYEVADCTYRCYQKKEVE